MEKLYISLTDWIKFLRGKIEERIIYAPIDNEGLLFYEILNEGNIEKVVYNRARPVEPLKLFLYPFKERTYPELENIPQIVVIGPASCDLKGTEILDRVFKDSEFKDPNYFKRKENTLIISIDCKNPYKTCFCTVVGVRPYPEENYDLNLSFIENGFIIEIGSEKGRNFIGEDTRFYNVTESQIKILNEERKNVIQKIEEINEEYNLKNFENLKGMFQKEYWDKQVDVKNCVSCGSCTSNCPTCVCFLLEDTSEKDAFKKVKVWDSCLFPGYAKMASGETPRPTLYERYANRLLC
ncbi:MAG: 4Fe-4S dicluster domain-containing protein, partial [bacterium]|nr:4Fe-4S dicluster domain-containing protein [bacterium]MDW8163989.1 4Fe-4S dicluster domain-containing protein [Candidatus Omnitrophota bacterium]